MAITADTANAESVLAHVQSFYRAHGVMPTYESIRVAMGFTSKSVVMRRVEQLKAGRFLSSVSPHDKRLTPGPLFFGRAVGRPVPAGIPDVGDLGLDERIAIDSYLVQDPAHTSVHRIHGDSMIERGLFDGDMALVVMGKAAATGNIVLARIDGAETIKVLARDRQGTYLLPANPAYGELRPSTDLSVLGVVTGTFGRR